MERPGPLFVYENTVEHTSWGPPVAAQNLRCINKEKGFSPGGFEKRLHGMTNLTGSIFEKQAGVFFLLLDFLHGIAEREDNPPEKRQPASQNQTRPCVALCAVLGTG